MKRLLSTIFILAFVCSVIFAQTVEDYREKAEQGNAVAQHNLGWCYYNGAGVEKNVKTAINWYTKAAEQGFLNSQINLGAYYDTPSCGICTPAQYYYKDL